MLVGGESLEHKGVLLFYSGSRADRFSYRGLLDLGKQDFGYMMECPNYYEEDGAGVLFFSPMGMPGGSKYDYRNVFSVVYCVGKPLDTVQGCFPVGKVYEMDKGFDFYAPQTTLDEKGRRILVGWLGLPGVDCITDENEWAHCLTLPRELQVIDGRLYQKPAAELENIRKNQRSAASEISGEKTFDGFCGKIYNLECTFTDLKCKKAGVKLRAGENEETLFYLDKTTNKLVLNREKSGRLYAEEYGQIRQCDFDEDHLKLQIFVDTSSIEIFVNDGLEVFTTRIYTQEESQGITFFAEGNAKLQASIWDLKL